MPDLIVQDEVAQSRVSFEIQSEQVLDFSFVPIGRMHFCADAGDGSTVTGQTQY